MLFSPTHCAAPLGLSVAMSSLRDARTYEIFEQISLDHVVSEVTWVALELFA